MNFAERSGHPSRTQVEYLLNTLEKNPTLAKGFPKTPCKRDAAQRAWERLTVQLNCLEGCEKTWKKWTKYWADKKSAVKKKAISRYASMKKNEDGSKTCTGELIELSATEERILRLMGGESISIQNIDNSYEKSGQRLTRENLSMMSSDEVSLHNTMPSQKIEKDDSPRTASSILENLLDDHMAEVKAPHSGHNDATDTKPATVFEVTLSTSPINQYPPGTQRGGPSNNLLNLSPSVSGSYAGSSRASSVCSITHPHPRRRKTSSSKRHRKSRLANLMERFLKLKQQRVDIDRRNSKMLRELVNDKLDQRKIFSKALDTTADGLRLLAQALRK